MIDEGLNQGKSPAHAGTDLYKMHRSGGQRALGAFFDRREVFTRATRDALQIKLREFEIYPGAIDGDFGPGTKQAARQTFGL